MKAGNCLTRCICKHNITAGFFYKNLPANLGLTVPSPGEREGERERES